jgi:hypothetical protein
VLAKSTEYGGQGLLGQLRREGRGYSQLQGGRG